MHVGKIDFHKNKCVYPKHIYTLSDEKFFRHKLFLTIFYKGLTMQLLRKAFHKRQ